MNKIIVILFCLILLSSQSNAFFEEETDEQILDANEFNQSFGIKNSSLNKY
eukprot:COSAG01_NODE_740_length_13891_cov_35.573013_1_plen_50_part_10